MDLDELGVAIFRANLHATAGGTTSASHRHRRAAVNQARATSADENRISREGPNFHRDEVLANRATADAVVIEPAKRALIYLLDVISPFDLPGWIKGLYANLVVLAVAAMALSLVMGVLLLPVFYAVYRGSRPE